MPVQSAAPDFSKVFPWGGRERAVSIGCEGAIKRDVVDTARRQIFIKKPASSREKGFGREKKIETNLE